MKLFKKKKARPTEEAAPQLTVFERRAAELPGPFAGGLPYAQYDLMERDAMVQTALTVKKLGVLAVPYSVTCPQAPERARFVEDAFARMDGSPHTILSQAMDAFAKGWSIQETVYAPEGRRFWIAAVRSKDPAMFGVRLDPFGRATGLTLEVPGESSRDLPISKFVVYRHRGGYGRPKGRSDLDAAHAHWESKRKLMSSWQRHLEKFATPTMMARCDTTVTTGERSEIVRVLDDLRSNSSITIPAGADVSPLVGDRAASNVYMDAIDFHNREIARAILGQTLTTDEGRRVGSLAMGKVHLQVLTLQLEALRRELADVVMTEGVIRPLVELNFGPGPVPRFEFERVVLPAFVNGEL